MSEPETYKSLRGRTFQLSSLDAEERQLVERFMAKAAEPADWTEFENYWPTEVLRTYEGRPMDRRAMAETVPFLIAQDLGSRLAIKAGMARMPDYRDEIEEIIRTKFATRKQFCDATGLSESLLSHVLHHRKNLAFSTLSKALGKIGYRLHISPADKV